MTQLTPGQAAAYLKAAGFSQAEVPVMVAIGFAESGLDTDKVGPDGRDHGVWMIRDNNTAIVGNDFFQNNNWKDPYFNAIAAKKIYDQQGFGAWSVHPSSKYNRDGGNAFKSFAAQASIAATDVSGLTNPDSLLSYAGYKKGDGWTPPFSTLPWTSINPDPNSAQQQIGGTINDIGEFFTTALPKMLWIGGGIIGVTLGVLLLAKSQIPAGAIASAVTKVAKK